MNPTFSQIDLDFVKNYLRIDPTWTQDDTEISLIMSVAQDFVIEHSHLTMDELDTKQLAVGIYLKMVGEMYGNRAGTNAQRSVVDPLFAVMLSTLRKKGIL